MDKLLSYLNSLPRTERDAFCKACGTTESYLRKAISIRQRLSAELCINIERESRAAVPCELLRPDVDWPYLRGTAKALNVLASSPNRSDLAGSLSKVAHQ